MDRKAIYFAPRPVNWCFIRISCAPAFIYTYPYNGVNVSIVQRANFRLAIFQSEPKYYQAHEESGLNSSPIILSSRFERVDKFSSIPSCKKEI